VSGEHHYKLEEVEDAYEDHRKKCTGKECSSGRFASPTVPEPTRTLSVTAQVETYFKGHDAYSGTTNQLADHLKLKETQVRQAIVKLTEKGRLEQITGGWKYIPKKKEAPKEHKATSPKQTPPKLGESRRGGPTLATRIADQVKIGSTNGPLVSTASDIAKALGISVPSLQNEMSRMRKAGLLRTARIAKGDRSLLQWEILDPPKSAQ
jgi:Mn-dependent DtxR family transcriptional regulator